MGQDRPLKEDQIKAAIEAVQKYSNQWSELEKTNLKSDILRRESMQREQKDLIDPEDAAVNRFEEEENQYINDYFAEQHDPENPIDEETKAAQIPQLRRKWITSKVSSEEFRRAYLHLKNFKVIKYGRFF